MIEPAGPRKPRRTELAVPASNPRFVAKAAASAADLVFLDLEDGVAPDQRVAARQQIIAALRQHDWGTKLRGVRINATSTHWFYDDLITVVEGAGAFIDVVILPKVNLPGDVYMLDTLLTQIETAQGMVHVEQIATASRRLAALIFGPGDYAASVGMPVLDIGAPVPDYPGHLWHAALSRMVVAAKAAGLEALDGPYGAYQDAAGLQRSAALARALGCDSKWAIHPNQIEPINALFTPTEAELVRAQQIVQRYAAARDGEGRGALALGGELIDVASLRMAEQVLAKGRAAGKI